MFPFIPADTCLVCTGCPAESRPRSPCWHKLFVEEYSTGMFAPGVFRNFQPELSTQQGVSVGEEANSTWGNQECQGGTRAARYRLRDDKVESQAGNHRLESRLEKIFNNIESNSSPSTTKSSTNHVSKCHIFKSFQSLQGWALHNRPQKPVPGLNNPSVKKFSVP